MKLRNVLIAAFLSLTLIPIMIALLLLYKSGVSLSKESYVRNLEESITVQVDYISQTIENNMIFDYRFANREDLLSTVLPEAPTIRKKELLEAFQYYLEVSEDKVAICMLLDQSNQPVYAIGEEIMVDTVRAQLPSLTEFRNQQVLEFELEKGVYSLGVLTPVWRDETYMGSLVSVYDKSYVFKIISSYYKVADTSTYICKKNGEVISFNKLEDERLNHAIEKALVALTFDAQGGIDLQIDGAPVSGYYKNIYNTPWYLVGFIDNALIYSFVNQFIFVYVLIIVGVLLVAVVLSLCLSMKVVEPINDLIQVMDGYQNDLNTFEQQHSPKNGFYETRYLRTKFFSLMKTIQLVQHNFKGIYQLYQSSDMGDINIDIDTRNQTVFSNKEAFQQLIDSRIIPEGACVVDRFVSCFREKDQQCLLAMLEHMRDQHLSVTRETELYTPFLGQKWFHSLVVPMYEDDRLARLFVQLRDITGFKRQEMESIEHARRDALTGLYNRTGFAQCVETALHEAQPTDLHGLLFIDMDYFKLVNDNLGHSAGDDLLCTVGRSLLQLVRVNDIVTRFGGDEFAVFMPGISEEQVEQAKQVISKRLVYPFETADVSFVVSASIGTSIWRGDSPDTLEQLLKQADAAMYQAKREFKQRACKA